MWELTLIYNKEKVCYLDFIYAKLEHQVKFVGGIIIKQNMGKRATISLAVPNKQKDYFVLLLLELISEVITQDYKYEYLNANLGYFVHNELTKVAFLKALTVFDKQTDKDLIKKQLVFENELNIDSFYYFKLNSLRVRWNDICLLVKENLTSLQASQGLSDLLKFLIKTNDDCYDEVHVFKKNKKYYIVDKQNRPINIIGAVNKEIGQVATLENLITLSPSKIVLHDENLAGEPFYDFLCNIFDDKVTLSGISFGKFR